MTHTRMAHFMHCTNCGVLHNPWFMLCYLSPIILMFDIPHPFDIWCSLPPQKSNLTPSMYNASITSTFNISHHSNIWCSPSTQMLFVTLDVRRSLLPLMSAALVASHHVSHSLFILCSTHHSFLGTLLSPCICGPKASLSCMSPSFANMTHNNLILLWVE